MDQSKKNLGDRIQNTKKQRDKHLYLINHYLTKEHLINTNELNSSLANFSTIDFDNFQQSCEISQKILKEISSAATLERRTLSSQYSVKKECLILKRKLDNALEKEEKRVLQDASIFGSSSGLEPSPARPQIEQTSVSPNFIQPSAAPQNEPRAD